MTTPKAPPPRPIALALDSSISFFNYVLDQHTCDTTLIICSTREDFLQHLHASIHRPALSPPSSPPSPPSPNSPTAQLITAQSVQHTHRLLHPTLQNLALTSRINLVFTPTLQHLRAYLATYTAPPSSYSKLLSTSSESAQTRTLAILNLLSLHRSTPHFSAQGLSRTYAVAVEAAYRAEVGLVVCECPNFEDYAGGDEEGGGGGVWDERVPLLNETIRFGAGAEGRGWVGRSVSCRRVAERWFSFEDGG